jgi:exopolyphosphatase/guanosine-5'-triphosphate,3'-diphosphate pyrophosphatase
LLSTEIIGISHKERIMVANMIRYNDISFPSYQELAGDFTREEYITVIKLNAILKTANVLDKSNRQKIKRVGVTLKDGILTITADTMADITLEKGLFHQKAVAFEEVFGIRPLLKQKRTGKRG